MGRHSKDEAKQKGEQYIGEAKDCESWLIQSAHIHTGYRINYNTPSKCFWSLF